MMFYSGISHYYDKVVDLFEYSAQEKSSYTIVLAARLSGRPHIGTLINFICGFMLANEFKQKYGKKVNIKIELLDNIADEKISNIIEFGSDKYFYKDLIDTNSFMQSNYEEFITMIKRIEEISNLQSEIYTYEQIQKKMEMRKAIATVLKHESFFANISDPYNKILHIRTACPKCGLIEKSCKNIKIMQLSESEFEIRGICPIHGAFTDIFSIFNDVYVDVNVSLRHFCKGLSLIYSDKKNNSLSIQVLGNDWTGIWPLKVFCEGIFEVKEDRLPSFLFSPLILSHNGKISKSCIDEQIKGNDFVDINKLSNKQFENIWWEIKKWFNNSDMFFANYNLDYIEEVVNRNE